MCDDMYYRNFSKVIKKKSEFKSFDKSQKFTAFRHRIQKVKKSTQRMIEGGL